MLVPRATESWPMVDLSMQEAEELLKTLLTTILIFCSVDYTGIECVKSKRYPSQPIS